MRRPARPQALRILIPGSALTFLMVALCIWPPSLAVFLEGKIYDSFLRSAPRPPVTGSVAVVDLDEASLARMGQWPWPRYRVARLLTERIRESGAAAVGLDVMFTEPDRTSLRALSGEIGRDLGVGVGLGGLPPEALDTDRALAEVLAAGPFVLGYQFDLDAGTGGSCVLPPCGRPCVRAPARRPTRTCSTPPASFATSRSSRRRPGPPDSSTSPRIPTGSCVASPW